jgi:hypothetical protein
LRTSSSVIFLSLLIFDKSRDGGAAIFCRPFFVMAGDVSLATQMCK